MSSTFLANSGSLETLKLFTLCGLSPCSAQIRCTLVWLTPISSAIVRTLQCVAAAGCSFTVFSTILSLIAALIGFLPGGLVRPLMRPPTPGLDEILLPAPDGCFRNSGLAHDRHD